MANIPYQITMANGDILKGVTDAQGATQVLQKDAMHIANVAFHKTPSNALAGAASGGAAGAMASTEDEEFVQFFEFKDDKGKPVPHHYKVTSEGQVMAEGAGERTPEFPFDLVLELESWPVTEVQHG
ncbi:hypothetical protein M5C90_11995 [Pseudomonas chlororaphis subsp. piscium]|nr:hypothetical protein M5C90_11995 [Pseudomonas chlororaphis subsp. piscium]